MKKIKSSKSKDRLKKQNFIQFQNMSQHSFKQERSNETNEVELQRSMSDSLSSQDSFYGGRKKDCQHLKKIANRLQNHLKQNVDYTNKLLKNQYQFITLFANLSEMKFKTRIQSIGATKTYKSYTMNQIVNIKSLALHFQGFFCQDQGAMTAVIVIVSYDQCFYLLPSMFDLGISSKYYNSNIQSLSDQQKRYSSMIYDWSHIKFKPMQIKKQNISKIISFHNNKRQKYISSFMKRSQRQPQKNIFIKTGKLFLDSKFLSKNCVVVDNLGYNDNANQNQFHLEYNSGTFYIYCLSTTDSIITNTQQINIKKFLKLNRFQNFLFNFSLLRSLDQKQQEKLKQGIQKMYQIILTTIPHKLCQIYKEMIQTQEKEAISQSEKVLNQQLKICLKKLEQYLLRLKNKFPEPVYQEIIDSEDQLKFFQEQNQVQRKYSSNLKSVKQLIKFYPFDLIKIITPRQQTLEDIQKHENYHQKHIQIFKAIKNESQLQALKKIKNSTFKIHQQYFQLIQNKANELKNGLKNRIQLNLNQKEQYVQFQNQLKNYHQKLKKFLTQKNQSLDIFLFTVLNTIQQNLRQKQEIYKTKIPREDYFNQDTIEDQMYKHTAKLFNEANKNVIKKFDSIWEDLANFTQKQLTDKKYSLLSQQLKKIIKTSFDKMNKKDRNFILQKYYESMQNEVRNLIKAKQNIWDNFQNNNKDASVYLGLKFNWSIVKYSSGLGASLGGTIGLTIGRSLILKVLISLGIGATIATIALPVTTFGTFVYIAAKTIKNHQKKIKARLQNDIQFFKYRWNKLEAFYDQIQKIIKETKQKIQEHVIQEIDEQNYVQQLIGVIRNAQPQFLKQNIKKLEIIAKQAKDKNLQLGKQWER